MTHQFRTGYMDKALFDLESVVRKARRDLKDVDFDTMVGTGFSGSIVIPAIARSMHKDFLLIRKDVDDSHHSGRLLGSLGSRWIFVDDFLSSGRTKRRVLEKVAGAVAVEGISTTYVGDWVYANYAEQGFSPVGPDLNNGYNYPRGVEGLTS